MAIVVFALAIPVRAQPVREIQIRGVVVSVDSAGRGFILGRSRQGQARPWFIRVSEQTQLQFANEDDDDDEDQVYVGDVVIVKGQPVGSRRILAKVVIVQARGSGQPVMLPSPFPVRPPIAAPQLFIPTNGETINTADILIVGRTVPGATVHIDVSIDALFWQGPTSVDTQADANGVFSARVNPSGRSSGSNIRIIVTSIADGVTSAPTTVVVRQY